MYRSKAMKRSPLYTNHKFRALAVAMDGFTIVELMMATALFSVVLLIITDGVIHFTDDYYKGVNTSATQTAAQNAIDEISQAIQFSQNDGSVTSVIPQSGASLAVGNNGYFCAGSKEFLFTLGQEYDGGNPGSGSSGTDVGLYELPQSSATCAWPSGSVSGGTELLSKNMRVADMGISTPSSASGFWQISLVVANGGADLLCNTSLLGNPGGCQQNARQNQADASVAVIHSAPNDTEQCKFTTGSQLCAVATLNIAVAQRLGN
jgi:prepilin-type N-terminal cleavage/methylation domain-containing protein